MDPQLKIAKLKYKQAQVEATRDVIIALTKDPVITLLAGTWGMLELQKKYGSQSDFWGANEKGAAIAGMFTLAGAQAIAPTLPMLLGTQAGGGEVAGKLLPLLGAIK